jgi:chorismate--pyruvate lyase
VTALFATHPLYRLASRHLAPENLPTQLWARRSLFHLAGEPLLVTEVFLPSLLEYATLT